MSEKFRQENKYIVLKRTDLAEALELDEMEMLRHLCAKVRTHRTLMGKVPLQCVVAESDWPEYEMVWDSIQQRMENTLGNTPEEALDGLPEEDLRAAAKQYYRMVHNLESQLAAAQSSAEGQFRAGMLRAAEICDEQKRFFNAEDETHCYSEDLGDLIRAEANQPAQGEGGEGDADKA